MTTITRHIVCGQCETTAITLITERDDTGREYIIPACLEAIDKEQQVIKSRLLSCEAEVLRRREEFRKQYPDCPEEEIEPHFNCLMCGTN